MMSDIEARFLVRDPTQIDGVTQLIQSRNLAVEAITAVDVVDRYLDTADLQILRRGWAYRWRDESGNRVMGLEAAPRGGPVHGREKLEERVAAFPAKVKSVPAGRLRERLAPVNHKQLRELFRVRNHRELFNVRTAQGGLVELAINHAVITPKNGHKKSATVCLEFDEVELELKEGGREVLDDLAAMIQNQLGLVPSRLSKFQRGMQTVGLAARKRSSSVCSSGLEGDFLEDLRERRLRKRDPAILLAYRHLLEQFEALLVEEPRAWEGLDPEGVHQMRVATRRVRAALRAFESLLPRGPTAAFIREFKWLADVLGDVRDLDVHGVKLQGYASEIFGPDRDCVDGYRQHLAELRREARRNLVACLSGERYARLIADFAGFLRGGAAVAARQRPSIAGAAERFIGKQYRKVLRGGRAIRPDSPAKAVHSWRIDCKRLRYQLEFFRPIYGNRLNSCIKRVKKLQDGLGEFQDACVAMKHLRDYAEELPLKPENRGQLLALGQLIHGRWREMADRRSRFRQVWKRFDHKGRRKELLARLR